MQPVGVEGSCPAASHEQQLPPLPGTARVRLLRELKVPPQFPEVSAVSGASVRVTGTVERLEPAQDSSGVQRAPESVLLRDRGGVCLWADISRAEGMPAPVRLGALLQLVGELHKDDVVAGTAMAERPDQQGGRSMVPFLLRARIARLVDGLDMDLYERCLLVRRDFEAEYCPASEGIGRP